MRSLRPSPAFGGLGPVGQGGGVYVRLVQPAALWSVLARAHKTQFVIDMARREFEVALEDGPRRSSSASITALGVGPGRWLFIANGPLKITEASSGIASVSDHTDGYVIFGVSGNKVYDALAKGVPVDLHPLTFDARDVAVTVIAHIGAIVWKNATGEFFIAVFRSYAESLWTWLAASAAEYGLDA